MKQLEAILRDWRELGRPAVDAPLLRQIQERTVANFGADAAASPAVIARVIADAGGELRHPDVIEFDAQWRQSRVQNQTQKFSGLEVLTSGNLLALPDAEKMLARLEELRREHEGVGDTQGLARLRAVAADARRRAELLARKTADESVGAEQTEVAEWLKVWLQTPQLFPDWLELRKRSVNFREKFIEPD